MTPDLWPKLATVAGAKYTVYQPQLTSWDGYKLVGRAAISVLLAGAQAPIFGIIEITAVTDVDKVARAVALRNLKIDSIDFPSAPNGGAQYKVALQTWLAAQTFAPSLDRMEAAKAVATASQAAQGVVVKNDPPAFVFATGASALIYVDGPPVWSPVAGTKFSRVINSRALILRDASGKLYLHLLDGYLQAATLEGHWTMAKAAPAGADAVAQPLAAVKAVDLMRGQPDAITKKLPSLQAGVPRIIVATTPTEMILTQGVPVWAPIAGTI